MANDNQNLLGLQANIEDVLSNNDNNNIGNQDSTIVDVETDDVLSNNNLNSNNDSSDNSVDNSNNSDNSVDTDVDVEVEFEDSFNDNSDNSVDNSDNSDNSLNTDVEVEVEDSFNGSFNDSSTHVDVALNDSLNDNSDNSVRNQDSFNITSSFNSQTLTDNSTTNAVGSRQYVANNGDFNLGGLFGSSGIAAAGFGGGHGKPNGNDYEANISIDNSSFVFDQSVNQVISTNGGDFGGNVGQAFSQNASIALGDSSIAAGGDVNIDNSVVDFDFGDVNIGNTHVNSTITDSFNDYSQNYQLDFELEFEDSFNDNSTNTNYDVDVRDSFQVNDSFTNEIDETFTNSWEWENEGNIFSPGAATTGGDVDTTFDVF